MEKSYLWIFTICAVSTLSVITGCSLFDGNSTFGANVTSLNTTWELVELYDGDGNELSLYDRDVQTVNFKDDNSFGGSTSCNTHGGNYVAFRNGEMQVEDLISTEIACQEPNRSIEFLTGLGNVESFSVKDGQLVLNYGDAGRLVFLERLE